MSMFLFSTVATAQVLTDGEMEYKVKVAYIYNFTRYIRWPASAFNGDHAPLVIGVLGENPFGATIDRLAKRKKTQGRQIVVRRYPSPQDYRPCHMLFVGGANGAELRQWAVRSTRGQPVLVIGETKDYASQGADANFFIDVDSTVGFEINIDALRRQNLRVDARLLKLATVVRDGSS